ncbi:MAG: hypothetical protein GYA72_05155 [Deltaproteobacteria bacterium]|nr:hypothetical protein [Deltaproteobacteria bacterium]
MADKNPAMVSVTSLAKGRSLAVHTLRELPTPALCRSITHTFQNVCSLVMRRGYRAFTFDRCIFNLRPDIAEIIDIYHRTAT